MRGSRACRCDKHGVKTTAVPWARPGANFTLLFEAMVLAMGRNGMTAKAINRIVGEHDTLVWRILEHYVAEARARDSHATATAVGVDETAREKGHVYVTLFVDRVAARVLTVAEGKDPKTVEQFRSDFIEHGGQPEKVTDFSLDRSAAFIKGIRESFPPVNRVAHTLKAHQSGVLRWFASGINNGLLEGFNSLVQAAKARSRGFRSPKKMATIIYLLLAKLDFKLPVAFPTAVHAR